MKRSICHCIALALIFGGIPPVIATAQNSQPSLPPPGSVDNPKQITSADRGPDIDPVKLAASPYSSLALFNTFDSFVSTSYAVADVWIYADNAELAGTKLAYVYPDSYKPTWGEVFDHIARQMKCSWSWNPANRQFKFAHSDAKPPFGVTLADGWRMQDRGLYIWHAPMDQEFGMDIYSFGHYTADPKDPELYHKVRAYFALANLKDWPNPPTEEQMTKVKVAGAEALYLKTDTPRPGGVWRQWCFVLDGNAFLIVSAMPKEKEAQLVPAIEQMVSTFKMDAPATRPAK